jgi:predicted transcriptional regulator
MPTLTLFSNIPYGQQLREKRLSKKLRIKDISEPMGTSAGNVSRFESSENASVQMALNYASILGYDKVLITIIN